MEGTHFDRLARIVGARHSRRTATALLGSAAAWPLLGPQGSDAGKHKKKKKATFCLNGQTIEASASKKSKQKLKKKGATPGTCRGCSPACPGGQRCCGTTCLTGPWANQTLFGSQGSGPGAFGFPVDVALAPNGLTAWIADAGNNGIAVWTRHGAESTAWSSRTTFGSLGTGVSNFKQPQGVSVTPDGLLALVADAENHRMSVWTRPGTAGAWTNQTVFGSLGAGSSSFNYPVAGAISSDGLTAWVADYRNNRISVWTRLSPTSAFHNQTTFGSEGSGPSNFKLPGGAAVSSDGLTLWVADVNNNRISVWSRPGPGSTAWVNQTTFGTGGNGPNEFFSPRRIAVSGDGLTAWIADTGNRRISVWKRPNASSTSWANQAVFSSPGTGPSNIQDPSGIAVPADGLTVLVTDRELKRISVWDIPCPA